MTARLMAWRQGRLRTWLYLYGVRIFSSRANLIRLLVTRAVSGSIGGMSVLGSGATAQRRRR